MASKMRLVSAHLDVPPDPPKTGGSGSKFQNAILKAENLHTGVFDHAMASMMRVPAAHLNVPPDPPRTSTKQPERLAVADLRR